MAQPTVLLVEDEPAQREVLAYNLEAEGFVVQRATNGEEALMLVAENPPDLILLDWMMPHVSGLEVCRRLKMRPETRAIPIIMLSARSEEVDKVRGLETGADDYVIKPYSIIELMARLRAQLRRVRPSTLGMVLEWETISLDAETHRVIRDGQTLKLGPTEFVSHVLEGDAHLYITHFHEGNIAKTASWNVPNILSNLDRLSHHLGNLMGARNKCPVYRQGKREIYEMLPDHCLPTLFIDLPLVHYCGDSLYAENLERVER